MPGTSNTTALNDLDLELVAAGLHKGGGSAAPAEPAPEPCEKPPCGHGAHQHGQPGHHHGPMPCPTCAS